MTEFFERRMFAILTDGTMNYPLFVEVARGAPPIDEEGLRREVAALYDVAPEDLRVVCHPRWAVRRAAGEHVVHVGLVPAEAPS